MLRFISLHHVSKKELTLLWNVCGQSLDFSVEKNISYHEEHLKAYCLIHKISLNASVGLIEDGRLIGFTLLGIDGSHSWIAFLGILPSFRRRGLAKCLLEHQLYICDNLKLQNTWLEVYEHHFMFQVYQTFGFKIIQKLSSYTLLLKDIIYLNPENNGQCYREVLAHNYFKARSKLTSSFSWRRREQIIKNYKRNHYYLSLDQSSGYVINSGKVLLDIWSLTAKTAGNVLSSVTEIPAEINIYNQISDGLVSYLDEKLIKPVSAHYEMLR